MGQDAVESEFSRAGDGKDVRWIEISPLAIKVSPLSALEAASIAVESTGQRLLLNHNLHSAYLYQTDDEFRRLYARADLIVVDGTPILWLASWSSRSRLAASYRISSTDWIAALPEVQGPRRLFVFGATASSNANAISRLRLELKDWAISGVDGYVDDDVAVRLINDFGPDLVIVGLGMPRQEKFLLRNLVRLPNATYATVGGAIDYIAGTTRLAPRWLGRLGMEWAWRLANEPRRLAYRYIAEPLLLFARVTLRCFQQRKAGR